MANPERNDIAQTYREIQSNICAAIEEADGTGKFIKDH